MRGDAGRSWISGAEVTPSVVQALGASLPLMGAALALLDALAVTATGGVRRPRLRTSPARQPKPTTVAPTAGETA